MHLAIRVGCSSLAALQAATMIVTTPILAQGAPSSAQIAEWIRPRVDNGYTTGIVAARRVGGRDEVVAWGQGERAGALLSGTSIFEIGSITKVFTTLLLADMVLRGEVSLDDPVAALLPDSVTVPSRDGRDITLLDLATATSGLPSLPSNLRPGNPLDPYADYSATELYAFLATHRLRRAPGERYEYSNLGMGLLGHALAVRTGMDYATLVRTRILEPLEMNETSITVPSSRVGRFAVPHNPDLDETSPWSLGVLTPAGGLRSTSADMLRFVQALTHRDSGPLHEAISLAIVPQRPTGSPNLRIALGWHVLERNGRQIVWHNGGTGGFRTFLGFDTATGQHAMVWSNSSVSVDDLGIKMIDTTARLTSSDPRPMVAVPAALRAEYVGTYRFGPAFAFTVTEFNDALYAQATGQTRFRLWPESDTSFTLRAVPARIVFERDSAGTPVFVLEQNGMRQRGTRP